VYSGEWRTAEIERDCKAGTTGCVACKKELLANMFTRLGPMRERRAGLEKRPDYVMDVLVEGSRRAQLVAAATMQRVRERMKMTIGMVR
jgi:tryptophanyl-tRNA synthetase